MVQKPGQEVSAALAIPLLILTSVLHGVGVQLSGQSSFIEGFRRRMRKRLAEINHEDVVPPPPRIAGPLLMNYPFVAEDNELRDMFEALLASAMNKKAGAHPAYVETIKQLTPDEARLLRVIPALIKKYGGLMTSLPSLGQGFLLS